MHLKRNEKLSEPLLEINRIKSVIVPAKLAVRMNMLVGETGDIDEIRSVNETDNSEIEDEKIIAVEDVDVIISGSGLAQARHFKVPSLVKVGNQRSTSKPPSGGQRSAELKKKISPDLIDTGYTIVKGMKARGDALDIYGFGLVSPFMTKRLTDYPDVDSDALSELSANSEQ